MLSIQCRHARDDVMHALSLPTWWIHITSVLEWMAAMLAVQRLARRSGESAWHWLALAMLPALVSAMCACTWHLYDNSSALRGLVVLQAALTALGNGALALATLQLWRRQAARPPASPVAPFAQP